MLIKDSNFVLNIIIVLILVKFYVKCEPLVKGRCGRPSLPPHAISPERNRFDDEEKKIIVCKSGDFVHHRQQVECKNGRWVGNHPRCGELDNYSII